MSSSCRSRAAGIVRFHLVTTWWVVLAERRALPRGIAGRLNEWPCIGFCAVTLRSNGQPSAQQDGAERRREARRIGISPRQQEPARRLLIATHVFWCARHCFLGRAARHGYGRRRTEPSHDDRHFLGWCGRQRASQGKEAVAGYGSGGPGASTCSAGVRSVTTCGEGSASGRFPSRVRCTSMARVSAHRRTEPAGGAEGWSPAWLKKRVRVRTTLVQGMSGRAGRSG